MIFIIFLLKYSVSITRLLELAKKKNTEDSRYWLIVKQREFLYIVMKMQNGTNTLENNLVAYCKVEHVLTIYVT